MAQKSGHLGTKIKIDPNPYQLTKAMGKDLIFIKTPTMTNFESPRYSATANANEIFGFLSDFDQMGAVLPADKVKNWQSTGDSCRFTVDALGEVGLRIVKAEQGSLVQYAGDGKVPFNFYLTVNLTPTGDEQCEVMLSAQAQLNPMMKMIASGPVQKFLDTLASAIAKHWSKEK
jgi:carbon monoxide dehydrogenase subunit G